MIHPLLQLAAEMEARGESRDAILAAGREWQRQRRRRFSSQQPQPVIRQPTYCEHLGQSTGESVKLFGCGGCAADRLQGIDATVFECELHGRCVTSRKGTGLSDPTIKRCVECSDDTTKAGKPNA